MRVSLPASLTGHFLVAMPTLADAPFSRGVVLLCQHDDDGAVGLLVNQLSEFRLGDILDQMKLDCADVDLLDAPVLIVPVGDPAAYVERYGEPDKARTGLGEGVDAWSVPYWYVDTAFAAMVTLLAAVDEGLGALFFGQFEHEAAVKAALGIPADRRPVGTIALGYAAAEQRPSRSSQRPRRPVSDIVHRGRW